MVAVPTDSMMLTLAISWILTLSHDAISFSLTNFSAGGRYQSCGDGKDCPHMKEKGALKQNKV